jgi:hypothetical protein
MLTFNFQEWVELIEPIIAALSDLVWGTAISFVDIINWNSRFLIFSTWFYSI